MTFVESEAIAKRRAFGLLLGLVLVVALSSAVYSIVEAVEEREVASSALKLQVAANEIAHADSVQALGGEPDLASVARSMEALDGAEETAAHTLDEEGRDRLNRLLAQIRVSAVHLLGAEDQPLPGEHDHTELRHLLDQATDLAGSKAARSERNAAAAIGVAVLALACSASLLARSRQRTARARSRSEAQIREGQRLQRLLDDSPDILFVVNSGGSITFRSQATGALLSTGTVAVDDVVELASPTDRDDLRAYLTHVDTAQAAEVFQLRTRGGQWGWFDIRVSDLTTDELVAGRLVTAREITTEVELRRELQRQASTDALTGLPNRRGLEPAIEAAREVMVESGRPMALLALDIDGFKEINDTLGHPTGDRLLVSFASRLTNVVRSDATLLRMGGDEFAVVLPTVTGPDEAGQIARRLLDALDEPFKLGDRSESLHTSAGLALAETAQDADDLVIRADIALYEAKRQSGTSVAVYDVALESTITRANQLARSLREAVYDEEFSLVYQPIVTVGTEHVVALEALLRWTSPNLGPVGPDEFIPIAEATGEICAIGRWVLDNACRQLAGWMEAGVAEDVTVTINVSARQLAEPAFVNTVLRAASRWQVPTGRLVIEVTETAALDQTGLARQRLQELKDAGLKISIDDFGSGYSNLGQLISVPFDIIKIDRSLLITLTEMREQGGDDPGGPCAIMQAIVSIASILDAPVVCEGVETEQQRASLQASGITHLQGYLTGRPSRPDDITESFIGTTRSAVGSKL